MFLSAAFCVLQFVLLQVSVHALDQGSCFVWTNRSVLNSENTTANFGLYYPDNIFRSNKTVLFTDYFAKPGSITYKWYGQYRLHNSNDRFLNLAYNWKRHDFKNGIAVLITHKLDYDAVSTPAVYAFGTTFDNTSETLVLAVNGTHRMVLVCDFHFCETPAVGVFTDRDTNTAQSQKFVGYNLRNLYYNVSHCSYEQYEPFVLNSSGKGSAFDSNARTMYIFKYENGVFKVWHDFNMKPGAIMIARPFLELPLGLPIQKFMIPPTYSGNIAYSVRRGNFYVSYTHLTLQTYMYSFKQDGSVDRIIDCSADPKSELLCSQLSFTVKPGAYQTNNYRAQPVTSVFRAPLSSNSDCDIDDVFNHTADAYPDPMAWRRKVVKDCMFDFNSIVNNTMIYSMQCYGIEASKLLTSCWNRVYVDWMKINEQDFYSFKPSASGNLGTYNYKLPSDFLGCTLIYTNPNLKTVNVSGFYDYKLWSPEMLREGCKPNQQYGQANPLRPVQPGTQNNLIQSCFTSVNVPKWVPLNFQGAPHLFVGMAITLVPATVAATVCSNLNTVTNLTFGVCVQYNVYGFKGIGVLRRTNDTFLRFQNVQLQPSGELAAFRDPIETNLIVAIEPCAEAQVTVITGGDKVPSVAVLYNSLNCTSVTRRMEALQTIGWSTYSQTGIDTPVGCLVGAEAIYYNSTTCQFALGYDACVNYTSVATRNAGKQYTYFFQQLPAKASVAFDNTTILIPDNFTIAIEHETLPVTMPKLSVDCARYVCGNNYDCQQQLIQYGSFCDKINEALRGVALQQDINQMDLFSNVKDVKTADFYAANVNGFNFSSIVKDNLSPSDTLQSRSLVEDLLFNKVVTADVGYMKKYEECTGGSVFKDLDCAQTFNGLTVLPPQMSSEHVAVYTTSALLGSFFSIPNSMQMAYRFNGIAVTQAVLMDNQKLIANQFNKAMESIQKGFAATNSAVEKLQTVVNQNAQALNHLVSQLGSNFGAISSAINDITQRLDRLEASVQIDRLITGRLQVLQTFVTQQLLRASEIRASALLAKQKMSECVYGQSKRTDFCGNGLHLMSFPQSAPYGMVFLHVLYRPTSYINATTAPAICSNDVAYFPLDGVFVFHNSTWMFTKRNFYAPEVITMYNTKAAGTCNVDVSYVNHTIYNPQNTTLEDFYEELEQLKKNISNNNNNQATPNFTLPGIEGVNASLVDLSLEMETLKNVIKTLNESVIDLKELGKYEYYEKWPWYIWLGFIAGLVAIALVLVLICCSTSCCSCFKGLCSCKKCCDTFEDDEPQLIKYHYP